MKYLTALSIITFTVLAGHWQSDYYRSYSATDSVADILELLGEEPLYKVDTTLDGVSVDKGRNLVLYGFKGGEGSAFGRKQSKHFVCTACHNVEKEDPDLSVSDPEARLDYVVKKGIPFLQGTTLYGAVNRSSFYNGDYYEKYGELVTPTRNDLREAIQLCAIECSQGRRFSPVELESVLAYLWTIDLKMEDLLLAKQEEQLINKALQEKSDTKEAVKLIKSKYLSGSPATFLKPPDDRKDGFEIKGDAAKGQLIYENSCLHCHEDGQYTFYQLDDTKLSFKHLDRHIPKYTRYSLYQVSRYGTSPMNGKRTYMPQYTKEKMSNQQLEDLRAYIEEMAE